MLIMKSRNKLRSYLSVLCVMLTTLGINLQAQTTFEAYLSGSNEVPALTTTASGMVSATLTENNLVVEGTFSGLSGDYSGSHIHMGMAGEAGGVLVALSPTVDGDSKGGTFEASNNTFVLTSGQIDTLMMQGLYVNIHSSTYAGGELRGQVVPEAEVHLRANLSGAFEIPAAKTMASGGVVLQLKGDSLWLSGSFQNLTDEFDTEVAGGSHLHIGAAGSNGAISLTLTPSLEDGNKSGVYLASENAFELTSDQKEALMNRMFYLNIHTKAFAGGELRGQVVPQSTATFFASLSGTAEVPSIKTDAAGALVLELHDDTLVVTGSFTGLSGAFDATIAGGSHLHIGHSGENGAVSILINADVDLDLSAGIYSAEENKFELSTDQIDALMARMMYANIHTLAFAGGELRGQVLGEANAYFRSNLSGIHEIQPVWTSAYGALNVEVSGSTAIVSGGFSGLESAFDASIAGGSHLHAGPVSANGNVEVLINASVSEDTAGVYEPAMNWYSLTEAQLSALYDEGIYANIHTTENAAGELRGQLLFGDNKVPDSAEILSPADSSELMISGDITSMFEATWEESSDADDNEISYIWQLSTDAGFNNIVVNANVGSETSFTTDFGVLDTLLGGLGIDIGGTAMVYHRVVVTDGSNYTPGNPKAATLERGMITSNETESINPKEFSLDQNYPNPFNPTTTIKFTLSEAGNASLIVYNMLGQQVAELANERLSAGAHAYSFDASQLSSGIYIYRLRAGDNQVTKRMTLIK